MPNGGMTERDKYSCLNPKCSWRGENPIWDQTDFGEERGLVPPYCPSCGHGRLKHYVIGD